ncbi:conserved Apicomplexan protein [Plasmodium yoelii yoelii]|nr:conserved Apicomplexan protein [Plasmodium yoelii yoelii]
MNMKFKLNYGDKKNVINLNLRKGNENETNNTQKSSPISSSGNKQTSNNISGSQVANRNIVEKNNFKNSTKNIKINLASSSLNKNNINTQRNNIINESYFLKNDNNLNSNLNSGNNESVISIGNSPSNVSNINSGNNNNDHHSFFNSNINNYKNKINGKTDIYTFEKTNINDNININDGLNSILHSGENINASDILYNNSGNINDGQNNSNVSLFLKNNKQIISNNLKIYYKNELIPYSFLYHKILTILKSHYNNHISNNPTVANKGISFFHVENMLINFGFKGVDINNHSLLSYLASSKQIKIDLNEKRICYINPYTDITNITALLNKINKHGFLYGYEINDDLINTNKEIYKWVNTLLYEKKIRCIRSNNSHLRGKLKCKNLPTFCDIYSKNKCDNCFYNLKGYIFFPLSYQHIENERYSITNDIKNLWDNINLPNLDNILKEYKLKSTNKIFSNDNAPKRKNKDDKFTPIIKKMKRIYNTHLFTADEIKNEFIQKK